MSRVKEFWQILELQFEVSPEIARSKTKKWCREIGEEFWFLAYTMLGKHGGNNYYLSHDSDVRRHHKWYEMLAGSDPRCMMTIVITIAGTDPNSITKRNIEKSMSKEIKRRLRSDLPMPVSFKIKLVWTPNTVEIYTTRRDSAA